MSDGIVSSHIFQGRAEIYATGSATYDEQFKQITELCETAIQMAHDMITERNELKDRVVELEKKLLEMGVGE